MSSVFCGTPSNHDAHEGPKGYCEGVGRVERNEPVIVETYTPPKLSEPDVPGGSENIDYKRGWADAVARKPYETPDPLTVRAVEHYKKGYDDQLEHDFIGNRLTANQIRNLKGFKPFDPVKVVEHYGPGKSEVANFISDQGLDFNRGNVVKYVSRAGKKDQQAELQDLEKAAAYLQMAYNVAQGKPSVIRDPETHEIVWSLFGN